MVSVSDGGVDLPALSLNITHYTYTAVSALQYTASPCHYLRSGLRLVRLTGGVQVTLQYSACRNLKSCKTFPSKDCCNLLGLYKFLKMNLSKIIFWIFRCKNIFIACFPWDQIVYHFGNRSSTRSLYVNYLLYFDNKWDLKEWERRQLN